MPACADEKADWRLHPVSWETFLEAVGSRAAGMDPSTAFSSAIADENFAQDDNRFKIG